jgi:uncharacterized protein
MRQPYLFIAIIEKKGKGVFTNKKIKKNTILEIAPVIVMSLADKVHLDKTLLHDYIFMWGKKEEHCIMALGWVPMYNHSYSSNCMYEMDYVTNEIVIKSVKDIKANEEITINYNGECNDDTKVWFDVLE